MMGIIYPTSGRHRGLTFPTHVIGKAVWDQGGDIRDVISIGKLVRKNDGPEEVEQIISTMIKYGRALN